MMNLRNRREFNPVPVGKKLELKRLDIVKIAPLNAARFEVDPRNQELKRLPAVLLKACG